MSSALGRNLWRHVWRLSTLRASNTAMRSESTSSQLPLQILGDEEEMMRDSVMKFAQEQVKPLVRKMDDESRYDPSIIKALFEQGLMGIEVPVEYNGAGSTLFSSVLAVEELSRVDPSVALLVDVQNTLVNTIIQIYGNDQLKERFLPRLATDTVGCFCLSEESSGSDAFALKTVAKKDGEYYYLTGNKLWITQAAHAGIFMVFANVDPSKGYKGITCFLADLGTPGLSVGNHEDKLGIRASPTSPVFFDNVKVHESNIVGEVGTGYKIAIEILNIGRIGIAAQMVGAARGALDICIPYTKERSQFGKKIYDFQGMQHQIAHVCTQVEAARLMLYNTARMKEAGLNYIKQAAMTKYFTSEVAALTAGKCVEWMGGVGFIKDYGVEKFYRDVKIGAIYEGTSNIQLSTIARLLESW